MSAQDLEASNDSTTVQVYTDVVEKFESSTDGFLVTPFDYKAVMSQIGSKTMRCWTCSSPVSLNMQHLKYNIHKSINKYNFGSFFPYFSAVEQDVVIMVILNAVV